MIMDRELKHGFNSTQ